MTRTVVQNVRGGMGPVGMREVRPSVGCLKKIGSQLAELLRRTSSLCCFLFNHYSHATYLDHGEILHCAVILRCLYKRHQAFLDTPRLLDAVPEVTCEADSQYGARALNRCTV